jgi:hypothetical protein
VSKKQNQKQPHVVVHAFNPIPGGEKRIMNLRPILAEFSRPCLKNKNAR